MKKIFLTLILFMLMSGCSTIYTQSNDAYEDAEVGCSDDKTIPNVYSGLVFDLYCISAENVGFFCLVDVPLSLIVDTIILPYSIYKQSTYGNWYNQEYCKNSKKTNKARQHRAAVLGRRALMNEHQQANINKDTAKEKLEVTLG